MLRQYDVAVIITVIVERGLQFFCSFVSADDDRWLIGRGTMMVVFTEQRKKGLVLSPGKKIETFREWHKNESKAHKINFNLYHRYSQYNCLLDALTSSPRQGSARRC